MNPLAEEWMAKGLADLATAKREIRVRKNPITMPSVSTHNRPWKNYSRPGW